MFSNNIVLFYLIIYIISIIVGFEENLSCIPNKLIFLSNCSFNYPYSNLTIDNRTLSMTVPYTLNTYEENNLYLKVLKLKQSKKSLIHFNLNMIECLNKKNLKWTSVESSSTLHGEFVRTIFSHHKNILYLSSGITYLRNLTTIDCLTKTIYRTNNYDLFQMNLKIESTLNDYCSNDSLCYPSNIYQCDLQKHRCKCRSPFQSYLTKDQHLICIHAVKSFNQCTIDNVRCLEWCHEKSSSTICICPKEISIKKYLHNNQAYCEGKINGICNSFIQCPLGNICLNNICQNNDYKLYKILSFDIITISIIITSLILCLIIIIFGISLCILRQQKTKEVYHSSIDSVYKTKQQKSIPSTSDYDNIVYGIFQNNIQLSTNDDNINDTSDLSMYHPKIVFLGGEEQLTAIYA